MTDSPRWNAFVNLRDPSDVVWFDSSARLEPVDIPAERPAHPAQTQSVDGQGGRTVVEVIPVRVTSKFVRLWVRRLEGPWPTPDELVDCLMDGFNHFGAKVDIRPDDIALVEVAVD